MTLSPRTPVLVGVGVDARREDDPQRAVEPVALMAHALERAARDAGSVELLSRASSIRVPRGFWGYSDPGRLLAERFGATRATTEIAEIGVLQTTLLGRAARDIAAGKAEVVLVSGGEARHRSSRAAALGIALSETRQQGCQPDSVLRPSSEILSEHELRAGLAMPVTQYAMIENALRAAEGQSVPDHLHELAALQAGLSRIAAANPDAWSREPVEAEALLEPSARNRMLAFPYTKLHCSQWNVDQAAGLILCAAGLAERLGIPRARWVFPLAIVDSEHMAPLSTRSELHRSLGFRLAGERAFELAGCQPDAVDRMELYSCFPAAIRMQIRELELRRDRPVSVTGGMTFAGGPLNNFVLQALAKMAVELREDPGSIGLLTAVSGIVTKQGVSLFSTEPRADFRFDDVTERVAAESARVELCTEVEGRAEIVSYTVLPESEGADRAILLCGLEDGRRTFVTTDSPALVGAATREELCGRAVRLAPAGGIEFG